MKEKRFYCVYIMTNQYNTVLYTGSTNNLIRRVLEHKNKRKKSSFTAKYNINKLVYYETKVELASAVSREKQIKAGSRKNKIKLIKQDNPEWKDLSKEIATSLRSSQ